MISSRPPSDADMQDAIKTAAADEPECGNEHVGPPETAGVGQARGSEGPLEGSAQDLSDGPPLAIVSALAALASAITDALDRGDCAEARAAAVALKQLLAGFGARGE